MVAWALAAAWLALFVAGGPDAEAAGNSPRMKRDTPPHTNRLIREKSPYLLQHADNPVDWYSWGEEAFEKARREDKPIFLSIGYSTCHWCHVMERESFEDPEVASILNEHFVSIKVDREERPDVDSLYMQSVIEITGQGGWPLSVFLTPELKPFYGGTYFPPEDRWGQPGFKRLLLGLADAWKKQRAQILDSSERLVRLLREGEGSLGSGELLLSEEVLRTAYRLFEATFDERFGGFGSAPKFPSAHNLSFLLRYWKRSRQERALEMVERTLEAMAAGGIFDQLGGGFHRYSTDAQWRIPHFEKMLYDQAILSRAYLEAHQATGKELYGAVARRILDYVLRDLTGPEGAFYSAEDADSAEPADSATANGPAPESEKKEGAFYLWTERQLQELLGPERAKGFGAAYGVTRGGNALSDPTGELRGKNVLYLARPAGEMPELAKEREILLAARLRRPRPHRDDKVLTDWNGLMISSLAFGSRVLEEPRYREAAEKAARFILARLIREDGRLLHRWRDGEAAILGTLEDYAFLIHGLVDLYEATFEAVYLAQAKRLTGEMVRLFWDESQGGFFLAGSDAELLPVRQKRFSDGAMPSGHSIAVLDLVRVGRLTMQRDWEAKAEQVLRSLLEKSSAPESVRHPGAFPQLLAALDFLLGPSTEIVIAGSPEDPTTKKMIQAVWERFIPNRVVVFHPPGPAGEAIEKVVPFVEGQVAEGGKPTAYVCRNYACDLPVTSVEKLHEQLER